MAEMVTSHGLNLTREPKQPELDATLAAATPAAVPAPLHNSPTKTKDKAPTLTVLDPGTVPVLPQSQLPKCPPKVCKHVKAASLAALFLIEFWSGVASLSSVLCALGASLLVYCKSNPLLHHLLSALHPDAQSTR